MTDLFLQLLNMSITASWLVLAVLVLRLVFKKAPRWILCLLWGVVALRLLLPFSLESALSLIPNPEPVPPDIVITDTPAIDTGIPVINETVNPIISETFAPPAEDPGITPMQTFLNVVSIVWIAGVGLMLLYSLYSYLQLYGKVRASLLREQNVYYCDAIAYPFILGLIRPRIYLPSGMPEDQIGHILRHERAHLSRRDHWWKPLGYLLLSVYWFNPIIWVGYILLCRDIEMACDEKVVKDMSGDAKIGYSEALVACSMQRRMILACPLAFGEVSVKQRIRSVLSYKKPAFWLLLVAIVASLAVTVCFLTDPKKNDGLYGNVSASKLTDAQASELLEELVPQQLELEFLFADESPAADSSRPHPQDENLWLSTDERFSSIQDIRDMVLSVMTQEAADTLYFQYLDGPFDSIEDGPEFLEYEGNLYVNMYAGGKGFSTTYLFETARIVERTKTTVTVEMNTQHFGADDNFIYTPTLVKTEDGWRLNSGLNEGYYQEDTSNLSLTVLETTPDNLHFTEQNANYTLEIKTDKPVTDLSLLSVYEADVVSATTTYRCDQILYRFDTLLPNESVILSSYFNDVTINRVLSYRDEKGVLWCYGVVPNMSGNGAVLSLQPLDSQSVEYDLSSDDQTVGSTENDDRPGTTDHGNASSTDTTARPVDTTTSKSPTAMDTAETSTSTSTTSPTGTAKPATCTHLYGQWTQKVAPSCQSPGQKVRACVYCGIEEKAAVTRLEHLESDWIVDTVATTQQTGAQHTECVYCKQTMNTKTTPKVEANHTHTGSQWVVTAYPGCTTTGSQSYLCACGVAVQTAVIPAAGHTEVTDNGVAATCTQSGLTGGTHCSVCNRVVVQQQTIAALGHSIKNEIVAPTSSAQGYTLHTCTVCGYTYKDSYVNPTNGEKIGFVYENNRDGTCTVTGYNGAVPEHLVIPQYSDSGAEVTTIGNRAFRNQTELKSVTLPTTIRKVEELAFYNCSGLTAVYGSEHISDIDISAFNDCTALTVIDLSGATAIDDYVLSGCSSLSAVTLSDQLKDLPQGMFANCVALTAVRLPSSLTTIGNSAFQGSGIRQITLPDSVTTISMYAFRYCEALEKITLSKSLKSIAAGVFERCYALNNVVLPSGLESIGRTAFLNCTALTDIRIPDSVNSIGDTCFFGCVGLASAVLPESLTYIPERLFMDCEALKSIAIPTNASKIGMEAFSRTSLTNVSLPNVASIDIGAFSFCSSLQSVDFGDALTTVCSSAFSGCTSLQEAILPDNVTTIGMWAFLNCTGLQKVYLGSNLTDLESAAFEGCTGLKTVFLPKPLEKIAVESYDQNPFTNCSGDLVLYSDIEKANTTLTRYFGLINYGVSYAEYLNIVNV